MAFSYNTSLHRSIQATPYSLTYGQDARLPSFPNPDIQRCQCPILNDNLAVNNVKFLGLKVLNSNDFFILSCYRNSEGTFVEKPPLKIRIFQNYQH